MLSQLIYVLIFCSMIFSQDLFVSKQYKFFKTNEIKSINVMELINEKTGIFKVDILSLEDMKYERYKKTMNPLTCELEFKAKSSLSKTSDIKLCKGDFSSSHHLLINSENPEIILSHDKFPVFETTIVLIISGLFSENKSNKNSSILNNGILREWDDNGDLYLEFYMKDGIKNGLCKKWYDNGQIQMIYNYIKGKLNGTQKKWYKDGGLRAEWSYLNDMPHGVSKEWFQNGEMKTLKKYKNGELLEKSTYDENGNKI